MCNVVMTRRFRLGEFVREARNKRTYPAGRLHPATASPSLSPRARSYPGLRRRRLQALQDDGCRHGGGASLNRAPHYLNKSNLAVGVYKCLVFPENDFKGRRKTEERSKFLQIMSAIPSAGNGSRRSREYSCCVKDCFIIAYNQDHLARSNSRVFFFFFS